MKPFDSDEDDAEQLCEKQKELRQRAKQSIQQLSSALEQLHPDGEEAVEAAASDGNLFMALAEEDNAAWSQKTQSEAERAKQSIQQLSSALEQLHPDGEEAVEAAASDGNLFMALAEEDNAAWSQKTQSEAVNQLKSLLLKQCKDIPTALSPSQRPSPSKEGRSSLPGLQDLVPMIHNQSEYIKHLEAEVKFCKEELHGMKQRVRVVVVENEKLYSELKTKTLDEFLKDFTIPNFLVNENLANSHISPDVSQSGLQRAEHKTWKNELEQLKVIHAAQIESLEAQVTALRKDLSVSQKECEEVKILLRHKEKRAADALRAAGAPPVEGLCLKCAQHEAVLAGTHTNQHMQTIDRLTKERDELLVTLHAVRASHQETQQREWSACLQVKQAVEMAEAANLHKAQLEGQCEQLTRELIRHREQLDREAQGLKERLSVAREEVRAEARKQKEELVQTVSGLSQRVAELEGQLDRAHKDKSSLTNQLEDTFRKLTNQEQDSSKSCAELQYQISQAKVKKEEAERELREFSTKASRHMEKSAQEVERLSSELVGCRQHLEAVQKAGSQWQAEALSLAEQLANAQRQLHLTRQDRENAEQTHKEEVTSVAAAAREKERELVTQLQQTEAQHLLRAGELDGLLGAQNSLIGRFKEECCALGAKLEELSEKSRCKLEHLGLEKQHLEESVKSLRARCSNLEDQCVQHGRVHQRMKDRLQQLDRHCQSSAQQVCELLAKQNQLMQERNTLSEEMQNLRMEHTRRADTLPL